MVRPTGRVRCLTSVGIHRELRGDMRNHICGDGE